MEQGKGSNRLCLKHFTSSAYDADLEICGTTGERTKCSVDPLRLRINKYSTTVITLETWDARSFYYLGPASGSSDIMSL
jgi:hypothetical protein